MARERVERPRWQHSDGRPYDEADFGFTRFVDAADESSEGRRSSGRSPLAALRSLASRFRRRNGTDT